MRKYTVIFSYCSMLCLIKGMQTIRLICFQFFFISILNLCFVYISLVKNRTIMEIVLLL